MTCAGIWPSNISAPFTFVACSYCLHSRAIRAVQLLLKLGLLCKAMGLHRVGTGFAHARAPRAPLSY